jgi:adenine deaminase
VATVSDPHEIANVLGEQGIQFMIDDGKKVPFKFNFGVPSCVPATPFETSGSVIDAQKVKALIQKDDHPYLAEMMNFPGVLNQDKEVMEKINAALEAGKPVDGHAPGLRGGDAQQYIDAGISTDHECSDIEEAEERIQKGMKIQIREGSAAKDFGILYPLINQYPDQVMLCSDDRHPDDLISSHINGLIKKGIKNGLDVFNLLQAAIQNPVEHYHLNVGLLRENDPADLIVIDTFEKFTILQTYIDGQLVYDQGKALVYPEESSAVNIMNATPLKEEDIQVEDKGIPVRVIEAMDNQLYTSSTESFPFTSKGLLISDTGSDVLKIVVYNRYRQSKPAVGFIRNFKLQRGAIASSIAHDSHNLIAVGVEDSDIVTAINRLIEQQGGIVLADKNEVDGLPLEIAGLMTHKPAEVVSEQYKHLTNRARELGCKFVSPFMTLSFMALPVIPELKITDQGLFDVQKFQYTDLFAYR